MIRQSKKGTKSIIAIDDIAKEDINFPEFCFGLIGKVPLKDQPDELVFVDKLNPNAKITISRSKFGLPTQFTRDLRLALVRIAYKKNRFTSNAIEVRGSDILEEMGLGKNGRNFSDLKRHLDILTGTRIKFIDSYYNKDKSQDIATTVEFAILDGYKLVELKDYKKKKLEPGNVELVGRFVWNSFFYESSIQNAKNLIDLDYSVYKSLEGDITKQLYSFLNKRSYKKDTLRIELQVLAYEKLGMGRTNSLSKIRYKLKASHKNLMKYGIISKTPEFVKTLDKKEFIVYNFSKLRPTQLDQDILPLGDQKYDILKQKLSEFKFTEGQIGKLFKDNSYEAIMDALHLFQIQSVKTQIKSPKKWVIACLSKGFDMQAVTELKELEKDKQTELEFIKAEKEQVEQENKKSKEVSEKVDKWILQNTSKYYVKCKELYDELVVQKNTVFLDVIKKEVSKTGKSEVEVIMEKSAFNKMVRSKIAQIITQTPV